MEVIKVILLVNDPKTFERITLTDWFFRYLNVSTPIESLNTEHFTVLDIKVQNYSETVIITSKTEIVTMSDKYKCAIVLDCSPSTKSVSTKVISTYGLETICKLLQGLSMPFSIKHSITGHVRKVFFA